MNDKVTETERAALEVLRSTGVGVLEAALVAREVLAEGRGQVKRVRKCMELGAEELRRRERTVCFRTAVEEAIRAREKKGLRARSIVDFRYVCKRLMRLNPGLAERRVRAISPDDCARYLAGAFGTAQQYKKARAMLSGVFSTAIRKGWCDANPVSRVEVPVVREKPVHVLEPAEIETLLETAAVAEDGECLPAVGLMLYAGIRPQEVERLDWAQVDLEQGSICILPQHSKTGGARRVSIHRPLERLLRGCGRRQGRICPRNWRSKWRELRRRAGWAGPHHWPQDTLRHTFASYHLSHYRDYTALQWEMGHRSSALLRTRYVDMRPAAESSRFWA